jgi:DNA invertase Pin-like site-specific DNA recombinase
MPHQGRPVGGNAEQDRAEPTAITTDASSTEKIKTAAIIGAWTGGAILAVAAGAPAWFGVLYAVIGLFAGAYRLRHTHDQRAARARPAGGPRPELAAQLALAPPPPSGAGPATPQRPSPAPRSRSSVARAEAGTVTAPWPAGPAGAQRIPATAVSAAAVASSASPAIAAAPSAVPAAQSSPAAPSAAVADAPSPPPAVAPAARRYTPKPERWVGTPALGYVLVGQPNGEDAEDPGEAIRALCNAQRLHLRRIVRDVEAAPGDPQARPALEWAMDQLDAGEAQTLVVARLGHLSDSAAGLPELLRWFGAHHRRLVAIDVQLDTATEAGWLTAGALAQVGGWEREKISTRTRRGLAAARARGRPSVADVPELRERIVGMRESGMTLQAIADVLNAEGVPTLRGGSHWRPSSVQAATGYQRPGSSTKRLPPDPPAENG